MGTFRWFSDLLPMEPGVYACSSGHWPQPGRLIMKSTRPQHLRRNQSLAAIAALLLTLGLGGPVQSSVDIADTPLFLTISVEPNILFIIDDSGSMQWETMPDELTNMFNVSCCGNYMMWVYPRVDGLHGGGDYGNAFRVPSFASTSIMGRAFRSHQINTMYYNPAVTYRPWSNADDSDMPPAPPAAAPNRPLFPGFDTRNLTENNSQWARWVDNRANSHTPETRTFYPAVYSTYNGPTIPDLASAIADAGSPIWTIGNYSLTEIRNTTPTYTGEGRENRSDCTNSGATPPSCTYAEEIQNFANWYTYHRNRIFTARAGIGHAFVDFGSEMRVGYGRINTNTNTVDNISGRTVVRGVRAFEGAAKDAFFSNLYNDPIPPQGTPLRRALDGAGQYFSRTDARGPWSTTPGDLGGEDLTCRQSFSILMTDGYTSGGDANAAYGTNRRENTDGTTAQNTTNIHPDDATLNFTYTPANPYQDTRSNTLADVAMYYWKRDLRPDLTNEVPTSNRNEAFWQHMVTYGVGLGVAGSIDPADAWDAVTNGTAIAWPNPSFGNTNCGDGPTGTCAARVDDLLHAAVNSRGGFFSAADPDTFASELSNVLQDIVQRAEPSATAAAASSAVLQTDTLLYTAGFRSTDWSGSLTAREVNADGSLSDLSCAACWDAEEELRTRTTARKIFTRAAAGSGTGSGVALTWASLHTSQEAALNRNLSNVVDTLGPSRLNWLLGNEVAGMRSRSESGTLRLLGDIVHSDPQFKNNVLYLGANDGMLHAFDSTTGEELFAYVPSELLRAEPGQDHAPVNRLMDPDYSHRYLVDGTPALADVPLAGTPSTVLVGTMGAGGRTVFALDVTNPGAFSASNILWEFSHPELGYRASKPAIVRLSNGTWAAVFGNGYNSASQQAQLFVVNLETGALIQTINTGIGSAGAPNGLAEPFVTDWPDRDLRANRVYAGDLHGNLWVFDVSSANPTEWAEPAQRRVLIQATDGTNPQPITSRPNGARIVSDPERAMIVFGTGSYFRGGDNGDNQVQSLYGIIDHKTPPGSPADRVTDLLQQEIESQTTVGTSVVRVLSDDPIDPATHKGWYIDLDMEAGERVITGPRVIGRSPQRVRFATLVPDEDPCGSGRRGFFLDFDILSGGRTSDSVIDLDGDGLIDDADRVDGNVLSDTGDVVSGIQFGQGERIISIDLPDADEQLLFDGSGESQTGLSDDWTAGRQFWQQLR